jgi:hypothetical protein
MQYTVTHRQYSSSAVHSYTQTVQQQYSTQLHTDSTAAVQYTVTHKQYTERHKPTIHRTTHNFLEECGPYPVFAGYTLAFASQARKKNGKTSVRVAEESPAGTMKIT